MKGNMDEIFEVMKAFSEGSKIEQRKKDEPEGIWELVDEPEWNWGLYDYRVEPFNVIRSSEGRVGGRIFFVDDQSDEEVEFYDTSGKRIEEVRVGDMPWTYKATKPASRPKYWVFDSRFSKPLQWRPDDDKFSRVSVGTKEDFLAGRINTERAIRTYGISKRGCITIWDHIQQMRKERRGCQDDWFVPSKGELQILMEFFKAHADRLNLVNPFDISWIWTSSEFSAASAWFWCCNGQGMSFNGKSDDSCVVGVRAF